MARFVRLIIAAAGICVTATQADAGGQGAYVFCDNGLRCLTAPCPSNSALDLASGKIVKGVSIDTSRLSQQDKALDLQDRLLPLHKAIFLEPGVSGAKYALSRLGKVENVLRSPLVTVEASTAEKIDAALKHAGLIN